MVDLSELERLGHRGGGLAIHPYFGKLDPSLARRLIMALSSPGQTVLDPFCGSGTVLHEAVLAGRDAIGWDSSPLACLITTGKLSGMVSGSARELMELASRFQSAAVTERGSARKLGVASAPPSMPRVRSVTKWFGPNALRELSIVQAEIARYSSEALPATRILAQVAFSKAIVPASKQASESSYRSIEKPDHPGRVFKIVAEAIRSVLASASAFESALALIAPSLPPAKVSFDPLVGGEALRRGRSLRVFIHDTTSMTAPKRQGRRKADLVVTSPPYLMSWDYGLYHKFRFYWLGFPLDKYEETEIGRHLRRQQDDVPRYRSDMRKAFQSIGSSLKRAGRIAMVNAPSIVYGRKVDTNRLLVEVANECGWQLTLQAPTIGIPGPHHGMYASLKPRGAAAPGGSGKREHVLVFERATGSSKNKMGVPDRKRQQGVKATRASRRR